MQVNHTDWIPKENWEAFQNALEVQGLTHRVVSVPSDDGFHISWVPGGSIDWLIEDGGWEEIAQGAWIRFRLDGKEYTWRGEMPRGLERAAGEAIDRILTKPPVHVRIPGDHLPGITALILEMGGSALQVHSIRPDGSIHCWDLPDYSVFS
jgi:hypothetical protein